MTLTHELADLCRRGRGQSGPEWEPARRLRNDTAARLASDNGGPFFCT